MKEFVIDVSSTGQMQGMHFDEFPLIQHGKDVKVERASEIFFNEDTHTWDVLLPDQEKPFTGASGFRGYDTARKFEVEWLQRCRKEDINPLSTEGHSVACSIRGNY